METTLSGKGQITIPKALRDSHGWGPGTKLVIENTAAGLVLKPASCFPVTDLESGLGCVGYTGTPITVEEMEAAIEKIIR